MSEHGTVVTRERWGARARRNPSAAMPTFDSMSGLEGLSLGHDRWFYRAHGRALSRALRQAGVAIVGRRILDVGDDTGHWLGWYARHGAGLLTALEANALAAERVRATVPNARVVEGQVSEVTLRAGWFDVVNVLGVACRIVEPGAFERALLNLARATVPGGCLVLSDALGAMEVRPARDVRLRPLSMYAERLPVLGFRIEVVEPIATLLNGGLTGSAPPSVAGIARGIERGLGCALYLLDGLPGLGRWANTRLLVARKLPGAGP